MQVARNFYLTQERTLTRKLKEAILTYRIEDALTKDQILELYMNQIYLGQRSYGFSSAARTYFGKSLSELSIAQAAMLAGVPKTRSGTTRRSIRSAPSSGSCWCSGACCATGLHHAGAV